MKVQFTWPVAVFASVGLIAACVMLYLKVFTAQQVMTLAPIVVGAWASPSPIRFGAVPSEKEDKTQ